MIADVGERPTFGPGLTQGEIDAVRHYGAALVALDEERMAVDRLTGLGGDGMKDLYPAVLRRDMAAYIFEEARAALDRLMRERFAL